MSNLVRELRARNRMSQEELAQKANTTRQTISRIEKGENPSFEVCLAIEKYNFWQSKIQLPVP